MENQNNQQNFNDTQLNAADENSRPAQTPAPAQQNTAAASTDDLWYLDNYIMLKDYYDRTVSRIAARCIRMGNIAIEEYPFYSYILDVLDEISNTGDYILKTPALYPYVEKRIKGGMHAFRNNLQQYKQELENNSSPEMIKEDPTEVNRARQILGTVDKSVDPTVGAGMNADELIEKLMAEQLKKNQ